MKKVIALYFAFKVSFLNRKSGAHIWFIKTYRDYMGIKLKESKDWYDSSICKKIVKLYVHI